MASNVDINFVLIECAKMYEDYLEKGFLFGNRLFVDKHDFSYNDQIVEINENNVKYFLELLVANVAVLLPTYLDEIVANNRFGKDVKRMSLSQKKLFETLDNVYDADGNLVDKGKDNNKLNNLRNALEHGYYNISMEQNGECYINYILDNGFKKKVSLTSLLALSNYGKDFAVDNKLAVAVWNNMNAISNLIKERSNGKVQFSNLNLLNGFIFRSEDPNCLQYMKIASSITLFYSLYQKNLETHMGPNVFKVNRAKSTVFSIADLKNYFKLEKLFMSNIMDGCKKDVSKFSAVIDFKKWEQGLLGAPERYRLKRYSKKISHLHHIRNAIAHGYILLGENNNIIFFDLGPNKKNVTYYNELTYCDFLSLFSEINISLIDEYLSEKYLRELPDYGKIA